MTPDSQEAPSRVVRLPRTSFEQRSRIYKDLRTLLNPGFLSLSTRVGEHSFALRSLSPEDYHLLQHRVAGAKGVWRAWTVASSIWMVDGQILGHDQGVLLRASRFVASLPASTQSHLYQVVTALANRVQGALEVLEAFLYESESRDLWKAVGVEVFKTGWGCTFGQNHIQRYWSLFNRIEDEREARDWAWTNTKFIVGAHAPKGIKRLNEKDWEAHKNLHQKREATRDRIYYETLGYLPKLSPQERAKAVKPVQKAETFEELQDEMKAWVEGRKDSHDTIVDDIKRQMRELVEERKRIEEERAQEVREALERESPLLDLGTFQALSGDAAAAAAERIFDRKPQKVYSDHRHNSAYDKYLAPKFDAGSLRSEGGQLRADGVSQEQIDRFLEQGPDPETPNPGILQQILDQHKPVR